MGRSRPSAREALPPGELGGEHRPLHAGAVQLQWARDGDRRSCFDSTNRDRPGGAWPRGQRAICCSPANTGPCPGTGSCATSTGPGRPHASAVVSDSLSACSASSSPSSRARRSSTFSSRLASGPNAAESCCWVSPRPSRGRARSRARSRSARRMERSRQHRSARSPLRTLGLLHEVALRQGEQQRDRRQHEHDGDAEDDQHRGERRARAGAVGDRERLAGAGRGTAPRPSPRSRPPPRRPRAGGRRARAAPEQDQHRASRRPADRITSGRPSLVRPS